MPFSALMSLCMFFAFIGWCFFCMSLVVCCGCVCVCVHVNVCMEQQSSIFSYRFSLASYKWMKLETGIIWTTHSSPLTTLTLLSLGLLLIYKTTSWWTTHLLLLIVRLIHRTYGYIINTIITIIIINWAGP